MNNNLKELARLNPTIELKTDGDRYIVEKPWNDDSIILSFKKGTNLTPLKGIVFPEELIAIYHSTKQKLEIIYGPLNENEPEFNRGFDFLFKGYKFKCSYSKSSKTLELIAKSFKEGKVQNEGNYRNLPFLRDFFVDPESDFFGDYFKNASAISFYIKGDFKKLKNGFVPLIRALNFYMTFYERESPTIWILNKKSTQPGYSRPCYSKLYGFPDSINAHDIDPILLDILHTAHRTSDPRLRFIFYFQVIEYCSYYYLSDKIEKKINKILSSPNLTLDIESSRKRLIEDFKDHFSQNDDSVKLEKTILENCDIEDVKNEIKTNIDFFTKPLKFEGGLTINPIISDLESVDKLVQNDLIKIKKNIEKIRNVLVHLRESRENKVILPTEKNNHLLTPYLFLIRRMAETIAVRYN